MLKAIVISLFTIFSMTSGMANIVDENLLYVLKHARRSISNNVGHVISADKFISCEAISHRQKQAKRIVSQVKEFTYANNLGGIDDFSIAYDQYLSLYLKEQVELSYRGVLEKNILIELPVESIDKNSFYALKIGDEINLALENVRPLIVEEGRVLSLISNWQLCMQDRLELLIVSNCPIKNLKDLDLCHGNSMINLGIEVYRPELELIFERDDR